MDSSDLIQMIGAYAGVAAIIGVAVLAALYFSQARELRRLRDEDLPAQAAGPPPPGQAAQRLQTQRPATATTVQPPATVAGAAAGAQPRPAAAGTTPASVGPTSSVPPAAHPPLNRPPLRGPQRQMPLPPNLPWYARLEPRMLAVVVVGVLILGAAAIFGISSLGGSDAPPDVVETLPETPDLGESSNPERDAGADSGQDSGVPLDPSQVTVAVLNGTQVPGLAAATRDSIAAAGFKSGNIEDAPELATESAVAYSPGNEPAARAVAKELDISEVVAADPALEGAAGDAEVVVVLGADQAQ